MDTHIQLLMRGLDVSPFRRALDANPQLWDQQTERTAPEDSPHHGLSDIWARYADPATVKPDGSHESVWYAPADVLPVRPLAQFLMAQFWGERLGGVLITRIKPGQVCKPHTDPGWHARYYDKYAVQIAAAPGQVFHFDDQHLATEPGDVFWFDNAHTHWVTNESDQDRITLIACIRTERTKPCHGVQ